MSQPLPIPASKAASTSSQRFEIGNFFQPALDFMDFDTLLTNEDWQERLEKTQEQEQQSRKKTDPELACADAIAAHKPPTPIDTRPDVENSPANLEQGSQDTQEPPTSQDVETTIDQVKEQKTEAEPPEENDPQTSSEQKSPVTDGMEVAADGPEMISLTTFDDTYSAPAAIAREPLVTTSVRLSVSAAAGDRTNLAPILASSNEGGLSPSLHGNPNQPSPPDKNAAKSASQTASSVFKNLPAEIENFRQSGQSQVQIELNIGEDETLKVRLQMRAGELRSTFITDSQDLREALQKAWPEFAQDSRDRGFRFGNPAFQNAYSQNDQQSQDRQRQARHENTLDFPSPIKTAARRISASDSAHGRTALWA